MNYLLFSINLNHYLIPKILHLIMNCFEFLDRLEFPLIYSILLHSMDSVKCTIVFNSIINFIINSKLSSEINKLKYMFREGVKKTYLLRTGFFMHIEEKSVFKSRQKIQFLP